MPGWFGSSRAELAADILALLEWDEASLTPLSLMGCITPQQFHQNTMEGGSGSKLLSIVPGRCLLPSPAGHRLALGMCWD